MDPVTLIVTALALGAAAGLKSTAEQVVKDAYVALKVYIASNYGSVDLEQLERKPDSKNRQATVKEDLEASGIDGDQELLHHSQRVLDAVATHAPEAAGVIGVNLEDVKGASLTIQRIISSGAGVKIKGADISGNINITDVSAGGGKPLPNA